MPKRGFNNHFETVYTEVNVERFEIFEDGTVVTPDLLLETGIIRKLNDGVKVLGRGELTKKLTVKADKFTEGAVSKIEAAGGKTEVI